MINNLNESKIKIENIKLKIDLENLTNKNSELLKELNNVNLENKKLKDSLNLNFNNIDINEFLNIKNDFSGFLEEKNDLKEKNKSFEKKIQELNNENQELKKIKINKMNNNLYKIN